MNWRQLTNAVETERQIARWAPAPFRAPEDGLCTKQVNCLSDHHSIVCPLHDSETCDHAECISPKVKLHIRTFVESVEPIHPMDRTPIFVARTLADFTRFSIEQLEDEIRKAKERQPMSPGS